MLRLKLIHVSKKGLSLLHQMAINWYVSQNAVTKYVPFELIMLDHVGAPHDKYFLFQP